MFSLVAQIVPVDFLTNSALMEIGIALFFIFEAAARNGKPTAYKIIKEMRNGEKIDVPLHQN